MRTCQKPFLLSALALTFGLGARAQEATNLFGTVVDSHGNPAAGAVMDYYQYPSRVGMGPMNMELRQHATTDSQGAFTLSAGPGIGVVLVTKSGNAPAWRTWYTAPEEPPKIVLPNSSPLAGMVVDDAGRPLAEAQVWVAYAMNKTATDMGRPSFLMGKICRELFSTTTSADGKFRIENFPADAQAILSTKKTGWAMHQSTTPRQYDQLPFHAGQQDIILTVERAGDVTGHVVERGTGQPLGAAVVFLQPSAPGMGFSAFSPTPALSAADGSFEIPDVPAGSYQVLANFTNEPVAAWIADSVSVTVSAGQTASGIQLQAYKGGVVAVSVLRKGKGQPIPNAAVSVNSMDFNRSGSTGTNGVVYFRLPPGSFNFFANTSDGSRAQAQAAVTDGQTTEVTVELNEPLKVAGIVRDNSGAAVAGARVGVFPDFGTGGMGAKTDANGHYELTWERPNWGGQGSQSFYLLARQSERKLATVQQIEETTTNLDLVLKPAMNLSARVQDSAGRPLTNAVAYVMLVQENSSFTVVRQPVLADARGRVEMGALPLGERYGWTVNAPGYGSAQQQMDAADPRADHYDFPPIILKRADRRLGGRVLGIDGKPAAGAQIWMNGEGQPNGNTVADADGHFAFDAVCEGAISVNANLKGSSGSADAMGGDTNIVIRFEANRYLMSSPSLKLTGSVYDASGKPVTSARVVVTPDWGQVDTAKTDASGAYSLNWQPQPGRGMRDLKYFVIARLGDQNLAAIEPLDTNTTHMDLRLAPGLSISGTVENGGGGPLPRANINLNIMAGNMGGLVEYQGIKINSDGTFTIPALPLGQQYMIFASASGYGSARKNIGKNQSRTNNLQLTPFKLKTADRSLEGQVLGTDGKPLAGAQVNINGNGQPNDHQRTDANGHFHFKVCDGPIQIFAWSQSGSSRNNFGSIQARGGDSQVVLKMGVQPRQNRVVEREIPLTPQPWSIGALATWPASHKTGAIILGSLQAAVLFGTAGGVFLFWRRRG